MIIFLREKFIAQIFMWIIAVVFIIGTILLYGGPGDQQKAGTEEEVVLKIGALEVTRGRFEDSIARRIRSQQNQRFRAEPDRKQAEKYIINRLIVEAIEGSANISDAEIEYYIRSNDNLLQRYNQSGYEGANYFKEQVRFILSATTLQDGIKTLELVTDTEAEQAYRLQADKAKVKFIEFRHDDYVTTVNVGDAEAEKYFQANLEDYKIEEQVNARFIQINPADFVSKSNIETYYTENQNEFLDPQIEAVKARHILKKFPDKDNVTDEQRLETKTAAEEMLKTVKAELAAGKSFADLAKTHSEGPSGANGGVLREVLRNGQPNPKLPPGDYFSRGYMVPEFDKACFDVLKPGEVSDLIETVFGYHIIQLEEKKVPTLKSFPEVEFEIRGKLIQSSGVENAENVANELLFEIEIADFETAVGLDKYKELSLTAGETDFFSKDARNIPSIGVRYNYAGLIEEFFDMEVDVTKTIETKRFGGEITAYFVATVLGKKPAAIPEFENVKEDVIEGLREKKSKERALADAQNLFNQYTDKESLDSLAKKYKAPEGITADQKSVQESNLFNLAVGSTSVSGMGNSKDAMLAAFNMSVGEVRGPFSGDSAVYIIELVERVEPDLELYQTDPTQKKQRYQTILQQKKTEAYSNWFAARKKSINPWIHEDYR
jgi:peptidyl-prolyl cis-trans isomerase D